MPKPVSFFVAGVPAPGGSKKAFIVNGRANIVDDGKRNHEWRAVVACEASRRFRAPLTGAIAVTAVFAMPRSKAHYRKDGSLKPNATKEHTKKPDATKLWRAVEDALTGIAWRDDAQVVMQTIEKRYVVDGHVGVALCIEQLEEPC